MYKDEYWKFQTIWSRPQQCMDTKTLKTSHKKMAALYFHQKGALFLLPPRDTQSTFPTPGCNLHLRWLLFFSLRLLAPFSVLRCNMPTEMFFLHKHVLLWSCMSWGTFEMGSRFSIGIRLKMQCWGAVSSHKYHFGQIWPFIDIG